MSLLLNTDFEEMVSNSTGKGQVVLLPKQHAMRVNGTHGCKAPRILHLGRKINHQLHALAAICPGARASDSRW
jgi:hypothetical protein